MKVSLTLTSYAALFLSVYFTDLSKKYKSKEKLYLSYTVFYFKKINMKALRVTSEMTEIVFFKALH